MEKRLLFLFLLVVFFACNDEHKDMIICDAEKTDVVNNQKVFVNGRFFFEGANQQTDEESFSGKYSIKVNKENPFGFTHKIKENAVKGYRISVWRKGKGNIVIADDNGFYFSKNKIEQVNDDWQLITCEVNLPKNVSLNSLKTYIHNNEEQNGFFDDFSIQPLLNGIEYPVYPIDKSIKIIIDSTNYSMLLSKRNEAIKKGILTTEKDSWVKGKIIYENDTNKIKVRLKGDWLDHLQNDKWSLRVKIKNGHLNNVKEFSLQTPQSRDFLNEWVFHKLLHEEDILTTKYEFLPLVLNGKSLGIYAFEEHFEKELLEHKSRRESPILKFDETGFWNLQLIDLKEQSETHYIYPFFDASVITPFAKKKIRKDSVQKILFNRAQNNLEAYKSFNTPLSNVFDVKKWAKFYALTDIFNAHHALVWHNQRFYYNPLTSKIEPVVYDAFVDENAFNLSQRPFLAYNLKNYNTNYFGELNFIYQAFNDSDFRKEYFNELNHYLNKFDWDRFYKSIEKELAANTNMLQKEFPLVSFNQEEFYKHINQLKTDLDTIKLNENNKEWFHYQTYSSFKTEHKNDTNIPVLEFKQTPIKGIDLVAYTEKKDEKNKTISLYNYHFYPIKIVGFGKGNNHIDYKKQNTLKGYRDTLSIHKQLISVPDSINFVFYKTDFNDSLFITKILKWKSPKSKPSLIEFNYRDFFVEDNQTFILKTGEYTPKKDIIIPAGKTVIIENGVTINLGKNIGFICYSPIQINGTQNSPVLIKGANGNNGFSLVNANQKSSLNYVAFSDLNANTKQFYNTGGVSIYKSDIEFFNCSFLNAKSEDGLNIVDANFLVQSCEFNHCISDAFDVDYGKGKVINCIFNDAKNDGLDVSFSVVKSEGCSFTNIGDKGVSCGEKSVVKINNINIQNTKAGIVVKDESNVEVKDIIIENSLFGIVLFNKKDTYENCYAHVVNFDFKHVKNDFLIDAKSYLNKQGIIVMGKHKLRDELFK